MFVSQFGCSVIFQFGWSTFRGLWVPCCTMWVANPSLENILHWIFGISYFSLRWSCSNCVGQLPVDQGCWVAPSECLIPPEPSLQYKHQLASEQPDMCLNNFLLQYSYICNMMWLYTTQQIIVLWLHQKIWSTLKKMTGSPGQTRPLTWINMTSSWEKICKLIFFQMPVGIWWHWVSRGHYLLVLGGTGSVLGGTDWYLIVLGR